MSKYKFSTLFITVVFLAVNVLGQKEVSKWYFGSYSGVDFMTSPPTGITGSLTSAEGCSTLSNANGNLLFYSNGVTIWNQAHAVMANGTGLFGDVSTTQGVLIVKKPQSTNLYYVFTLDDALTNSNGLRYSIVDMSLAAGMGSVTIKNAPIYVPNRHTEKLTGTMHCNGIDIWIVTHDWNSADFRCYLLTAAGLNISSPIISNLGSVPSSAWGQIKISPSGKKIAMAEYWGSSAVEIFDFNNATGVITNSLSLPVSNSAYGVEFSPDGSKLYCTGQGCGIIQFNLCAGSDNAIISSQYTVFPPGNPVKNAAQLAPDGKIYVARSPAVPSNALAIIRNPNSSGVACNYIDVGLTVPGTIQQGLTSFVASMIKPPATYSQDLSCLTVSFTAPSIAIPSLAGCPSVAKVPVSISWNFGDPASGANNTSTAYLPVHIYPALGSYNIKTVINYANCAADTINQTINLVSASLTVKATSVSCSAFATATAIVQGGSGAYNFTWAPSAQSTSIATNLSGGIYTITAMNQGGFCSASFTTAIAPPVQITASFNTILSCTTASAVVTVTNGSGNYTYSWSPGTQSTSNVSGLAAGIHTLTVTDPTNQCSFTQTIQISTLATPVLSVTGNFSFCPGQSASLTAVGADTYTWSNTLNSSTVVLTPTIATSYTISGTFTNTGCYASKIISVVPSKCLDIEELFNAGVKIYPNPVQDHLIIDSGHEVCCRLYNEKGEMLLNKTIGTGQNKLNFQSLANGIYLLTISIESKMFTIKILKQD